MEGGHRERRPGQVGQEGGWGQREDGRWVGGGWGRGEKRGGRGGQERRKRVIEIRDRDIIEENILDPQKAE